jgi:hypothetical protein
MSITPSFDRSVYLRSRLRLCAVIFCIDARIYRAFLEVFWVEISSDARGSRSIAQQE